VTPAGPTTRRNASRQPQKPLDHSIWQGFVFKKAKFREGKFLLGKSGSSRLLSLFASAERVFSMLKLMFCDTQVAGRWQAALADMIHRRRSCSATTSAR
tara:strand:- start:75 stop:371 length:297 start_codon:yes stop_codon:yes gene_type:complete